jgi:hypothetical protein
MKSTRSGATVDADAALNPYIDRVGRSPQGQLGWALRLAQRQPESMTPGDWDNMRHEITAFLALHGYSSQSPVGHRLGLPPEEVAHEIRKQLHEILAAVIQRGPDPIHLGRIQTMLGLCWRDDVQRFTRWTASTGYPSLIASALQPLLEQHGHLVRACGAPSPRGGADETCGLWFVAARVQQRFCSPRCQSRATTRAYREKSAPRNRRPKARLRRAH